MKLQTTAICITMIFAAGLLLAMPAFCAPAPTQLNVKDYGAVGDGKTDDSDAILKAIKEARSQKLPVCFPKGYYVVTKPIEIEDQALMGSEPGGWPADSGPMATLLINHTAGPAVTARSGATVHALNFLYDEKSKAKFPATILLDGTGVSVSNVRIQYCWDGIMAGSSCGRLNIENVFLISPGGTGVYVARSFDIPTIRNIEVWNNVHRQGVTAFRFGRNDGLRGSHLVAFNVAVGFELGEDPEGGTWGSFVDCGTDACGVAWKADGKTGHTVSVTGGFFWNHHQSIQIHNPNICLRVSNAELQSNGAPVVETSACHTLLLTGCRIGRAYENPGVPFFNLQGVQSFTMGQCSVTNFSPIFKFGPDVKAAAIVGNVFAPSPFARIVEDNRSKTAEIIFASNAGMTPTEKKEESKQK